jgi:phosphate-selective porin OprO and OprP
MLQTANKTSHSLLALACLLAATYSSTQAGTPAASGKLAEAVAPKEESIYDRIWSKAKIYKNKDGFIQEIALSGRAQWEYFNVDSDQGDADDWETRRLRSGLKIKFADKWLIHAEASFDADHPNPFYTKMTDAYLQYTASEQLVITVGKQSVKFGLDGGTSSKELITIDRSNLANNLWFTEEYAPGVSVSGKSGNWNYYLGGFTSDGNPEFGDFAAGGFILARVGYSFAEALRADEAMLWLDYVYQTSDEGNSATRPFQNIGSINFLYENGKWGVGSDVIAGQGYGKQGDIFGVQFMPFYNITEKVQAVFRYTHLNGDDNAIRLARYENRVVSGKGDNYNEFYAGLNWYLYGHKLKFQTGVQYAMMDDSKNDGGEYDGWQVVSGIRISW